MKSVLAVMALIGLLWSGALAGPFTNGGFEVPQLPTNSVRGFQVGDTNLTGWTVGGPAAIVVTLGNGFPQAFSIGPIEGSQHITFNGGDTATGGTVSQTFNTKTGQTYNVSFNVGRGGGGAGVMQVTAIVTASGGAVLGVFAASQATPGWGPTNTFTFAATSATSTLTFQDTSTATTSVDVALDNVAVQPQIIITARPLSQTVNAGDNASFAVAVADTGVQFQWRFNGTNLPGQTNSTLTLQSVKTNQAGFYTVLVSNSPASLLSDPAELIVPLPGQPGSKKWQFTFGAALIATTPALAKDGTVYVAANGFLIALNPSGSQKWLLAIPDIWAAPVVSEDGTIYVSADQTNLLYAVNPNGTLRWQTNVLGVPSPAPSLTGDGAVLVPANYYPSNSSFAALNTNATIRWAFDPGGRPTSAAIAHDGTIYIGNQDTNHFQALKPDGTIRWSQPFPVMWGMPIVGADGTVYVGTRYDQSFRALDPQGNSKWQHPTSDWVGTSPSLAADGTIFCLSRDGHLYAFNPDGSDKWVYNLGAVSYSAPAVSKRGTIYTSADDKKVIAINPDGTKQWEFATGSDSLNPYEGRRPSPTIAPDGTIYFPVTQPGRGGVLFAIQGDSGPAESPWPMAFQNAQHTSRVPFAITNQPASQIIWGGSNVVFAVGVASTQPCAFKWRRNGTDIASQTNASLLLAKVGSNDSGTYACLVSNRSGFYVSRDAILTVLFTPVFADNSTNMLVLAGSNVVLTAKVDGPSSLSYQWAFNGTNLPNATNTILSLNNVGSANAGVYALIVSNISGSVTSAPAFLDVRYGLAYGNGTLLTGSNYTFIGPVNVSLWSVFTNASVFYTLDGSPPTFASAYYNGPFSIGSSATLRTITYSADFSQWGDTAPIQLTVIPIYTLASHTAGGGTIQVAPGGLLTNGVVANVTAIALPGWSFLGWLGDASGTSPTAALTMNRNKVVEARFGTSLSTTIAGNGYVAVFPSVPLLPYGTIARLTATPQPGNYFGVWGNAGSGNANPLYFAITNANPVVSSLFAPLTTNQYSLVVLPNGDGRVTNSPFANFYTNGGSVTLTALANAGQSFTGWSGDATGSANPLNVTVNQSKTITANFTKRPTLSAAPDLAGWTSDGFRLLLSGEFGGVYQILGSTDFTNWPSLGVVTNSFGASQFTDPGATNLPLRFYKAVETP